MKSSMKIFLPVIFILLLNYSCSTQNEKMPLTTNSEEALKEYIEGRNLAENLRGLEALAYFKNAIELDENFAMAYVGFAFNNPTAKGFFENLNKAVSLIDKVSEGERTYILGVDAGVNGHLHLQQTYFEQLVNMYPGDERAHNFLGNNYFAQQLFPEAIAQFQKAIKINPDYAAPYNSLGYAYRPLGKFDKAEEAFKNYIDLIPDDPNPYDSYAELMLKMGEFDKSIMHYEKALEKDNNFVASYLGIAANLNYKGEYDGARNKLNELLTSARNDGERRTALNNIAISYVDEGKLDKAIDYIKQQYELAEKINDKAAMSNDLALLGNVYYEMGELEKAFDHYKMSVEMADAAEMSNERKENIRLLHFYNTGSIAMKKGSIDEAKNKCDEFIAGVKEINNPNQMRLARQLSGLILMKEGNYEEAARELKRANMQNPYNLFILAKVYKEMDSTDLAKKFLSKAANFYSLPNLQYAFVRNKANQMLSEL
jgi:tetratricopeptide (TPR) repeat protein